MIKDKCGDEAAEVFPSLIESVDLAVFGLCKKSLQYHPNNPKNDCSGILKPSLNDPKGLFSKSFFFIRIRICMSECRLRHYLAVNLKKDDLPFFF